MSLPDLAKLEKQEYGLENNLTLGEWDGFFQTMALFALWLAASVSVLRVVFLRE